MQGPLIDDTIAGVRLAVLSLLGSLFALVILAPGCNASCKAMDVQGQMTTCSNGARGYVWTGISCIYTAVCNCTGADCQRLYATQDGCETAHIHCR